MTAKSLILAAQLFVRSIFWWPREGQGVLPEKSNTASVPADEVSRIGEAYLAGFLRGWALAWYSRLFGVESLQILLADWLSCFIYSVI